MRLSNIASAFAALAAAAPSAAAGFYVPPVVAMREMTPAEEAANRAWNLRAALNVAALQCQFSPFLRTVANYNDMLRHHAAELDKVRITLVGHFKRHDGKIGPMAFDQYTTKTYSSYSTLDAQLSFCDAAASAGFAILSAPKGGFIAASERVLPAVRASLAALWSDPRYIPNVALAPPLIPAVDARCLRKKGKVDEKCLLTL